MTSYTLRPTYTDLKTRIAADLAAMPAVLRGPLSAALARANNSIHGHLEWIDRQTSPLTCDLERLYDWATLYNVARLDATASTGGAVGAGANGVPILAGTQLRGTANGLDYTVQAAIILGQSSTVTLKCNTTGSAGNLVAGQTLRLIDPLPGCDDIFTVDANGLSGGEEEEDLEDWRSRVAEEWQTIVTTGARSGKDADYRFWAKSAHPSVTTALVQPHVLGIGTVLVRPICNGLQDRLPTQAVLDAVSEKLSSIAPATADWRVAAPLKRLVTASLHLQPGFDTEANRTSIGGAVLAAILAEASETSILAMAELDAAIATVTTQYQRIAPTADIAVAAGEVLVYRPITWL
ncbi:baseplate J/gp47 family protein [Herbaspirillum sp.]|uniref:baseplate J/gp47 family protein n=1 Tax=Herbaspirillum sp. TaxID=1890675 RepID=UPI001AFE6710|nr:baseplate J/gp47 family protein [Herbaspirillum sp.]MBO9538771.1 baseplate J/gp47 family protein [Herbaspirillum sp.]